MVTIKVRQNGPYRVEGDDVTVVDWNGVEYPIVKRPIALCDGLSRSRSSTYWFDFRPFSDSGSVPCA